MLKYIGIVQFRGKLSITPSRFNKRERQDITKKKKNPKKSKTVPGCRTAYDIICLEQKKMKVSGT